MLASDEQQLMLKSPTPSESFLCIFEENGKVFLMFVNFGGCFFICVEVATVGMIYSPSEHQFFA